MLKVECESCRAPYQVDERRVPATGLKMRCPKCGHSFLVTDPNAKAAPEPSLDAAPPQKKMKSPTMIGVAPGGLQFGKPSVEALPTVDAPPPSAALTPPDDVPDLPLPAPPVEGKPKPTIKKNATMIGVAPAGLGLQSAAAAKPALPAPDEPESGALPVAKPVVARPAVRPTITKKEGPKPAADELDLPAVPADLPAAAPKKPPVPPPRPRAAPTMKGMAPDSEPGLPAVAAAAPELPVAKPAINKTGVNKPPVPVPNKTAAYGGGVDLPAVSPDLPAVSKGRPAPPSIDLPVVSANLPATRKAPGLDPADLPARARTVAADLPVVSAGLPVAAGAGLPSPAGLGLPVVAGGNLPMVAQNLPVAADIQLPTVGGGLPSPKGFGEIDLPEVTDALPDPAAHDRHLPDLIANERLMPQAHQREAPVPSDDFGDLDLPPPEAVDGGMPLPIVSGAGIESRAHESFIPDPASFSELPPADPAPFEPLAAFTETEPTARKNTGINFGEVDLGGDAAPLDQTQPAFDAPREASLADGFGGDAFGEPPPAEAGETGDPFAEAADTAAQGGVATEAAIGVTVPETIRRTEAQPASSRARKATIVGLMLVLVAAGGALQVTPFGAFGYWLVVDKIRGAEYTRVTEAAANQARAKLATDVYSDARTAVDIMDGVHKKTPRARSASAYAALAEYSLEVRFGVREGVGRAQTWLRDVAGVNDTQYLPLARAAEQLANGDLVRARKTLDTVGGKYGNSVEGLYLRGELELASNDAQAATEAFTKLAAQSPNARAHFGMARARFLAGDAAGTKEAVQKTIEASSQHAGAYNLRAELAWAEKNEQDALKDLATVLDGPIRANAAPSELARAYTVRGWIHLTRGRPSEARAAFDDAVKLDARNIWALLGQGEVLYTEGRYTEALSRFDTAAQVIPGSIEAITGDAKSKIALERLSDAKSQLAAARATYPKDMRLAYWLAKAEEALGNKAAAERQYLESVDLADGTMPDQTIMTYASLSSLLAGQGRAAEAEAKLEQARNKLPQSVTLERTFGDVAAAQGHYHSALEHYQQGLALEPNDTATRFRLGTTLRRMRELERAAAELDKVYAADKDYPGLALERGLLYEESGNIEQALSQFKTALARAPNDLDLMLRIGAAYVAVNHPDDAIPILKKVLEQRPNSGEANHYYGRAFLSKGGLDLTQAMRHLKRAVELDPNRAEYHLYVGWAANEGTDIGLARKEIDKALQLDKLLADAYWQRGVVLRKGGAIEDAIRDLKEALRLRPNRIEAHAALAECYEDRNDMPSAFAEWQKAFSGADRAPPYWNFKYGRLLLEKNQLAPARDRLLIACKGGQELQPRPAWVVQSAFLCGEALRKTGDRDEAVGHYRTYLQLSPANAPDRRDVLKFMKEMGVTLD